MASYTLRKMDDAWWARVKAAAALAQMTLQAYVETAVEQQLKKEK